MAGHIYLLEEEKIFNNRLKALFEKNAYVLIKCPNVHVHKVGANFVCGLPHYTKIIWQLILAKKSRNSLQHIESLNLRGKIYSFVDIYLR